MVRLYVHKIAKLGMLGSNDTRYVINWLNDNDIEIFPDTKKKRYVNQIDFELAYNRDQYLSLMRKYPNDWGRWYKLYNTGDITALMNQKYSFNMTNNINYSGDTYNPLSADGSDIVNEFLGKSQRNPKNEM